MQSPSEFMGIYLPHHTGCIEGSTKNIRLYTRHKQVFAVVGHFPLPMKTFGSKNSSEIPLAHRYVIGIGVH
jgi:hypothetical protein